MVGYYNTPSLSGYLSSGSKTRILRCQLGKLLPCSGFGWEIVPSDQNFPYHLSPLLDGTALQNLSRAC